MNREELIEEAAKAMYGETWTVTEDRHKERYRNLARSALAVFEKAHAPTDDGREVKRLVEFHGDGVWRDETGTIWVQQSELVDAIRRSEVPEPSDENYDEDTLRKAFDALVEVTGSEITADDCINQMQNAGILFRERGAEPQGEPSDAQLGAAQVAMRQRGLIVSRLDMRTALRAAGEVAPK